MVIIFMLDVHGFFSYLLRSPECIYCARYTRVKFMLDEYVILILKLFVELFNLICLTYWIVVVSSYFLLC